ncbi:MAG: flagellar biosynthetic protein FliO [Candidatus Muiribacteriota bacterium]
MNKFLIFISLISLLFINIPASMDAASLFDDEDFLSEMGTAEVGISEQNQTGTNAEQVFGNQNPTEFRSYVIKFFFVTVIIVGAILFIFFYMKRKNPQSFKSNIKIIENYGIGNGKSIMIVKVLEELLVIGISGNNITLLTKITDTDTIKEVTENGGDSIKSFKELLLLSSLDNNNKK